MAHEVNIFLLLFGALQGAILSLWLLRNQRKRKSDIFFTLLLVTVGLQLTFKVISKLWLMQHVLIPYYLSYKLPYLVGPLIFLYVKTRKVNELKWLDLCHFIPFVGAFTFALIDSWLDKRFFYIHAYAQAALQWASLWTYAYLAWKISARELKSFIKVTVLAETIVILTLAVMYVYYGRFPDVRLLFVVLTFLIYWISYKVIASPQIFLPKEVTPVIALQTERTSKYAHSSLKPSEAARIESELNRLMSQEKLFLDSSLTIDKLSAKLQTSRHHLSQVLNEKLNRNYTEYITDLRLEECRKRLADPSNFRFTIAGLALDSGFSSVSSFNEVFKKRFGITPSRFRDQQLNSKMSA